MKLERVFTHAVLWLLVVVMALPSWAFAQEAGGAPPSAAFSREQLEQILAPIALYPDDVIAQVLMASTYPIEVVQADRWVKKNKDLKGDALTVAREKEGWDPSVKSLVNFPQVLQMMSEKLDWTEKMGDAFLGQEKDVIDTVQVLRRKAEAAGNLKTTQEQKVIVEKETIIIQPANPQVIYIPTYNPTVVYGAWPYPANYRSSGIMTFIVNQEGVVYQKDLGKNTAKVAKSMKRYDPDTTWEKVEETKK